jgi:defect in organelle trafficking protein DotB
MRDDISKYVFTKTGRFNETDLPVLLNHCDAVGDWSDLYIMEFEPIKIRAHGNIYPVFSAREITDTEVAAFLTTITGNPASPTYVKQGNQLDPSYSHFKNIETHKGEVCRYRVNVVCAMTNRGQKGIQITIRKINYVPRPITDMDLEPAVLSNVFPRVGLVVIAGETGSGKSTLLAAILRYINETPNGNKVIHTYESPIEFVHSSYPSDITNSIYQSEVMDIGGMVKSFSDGVRASLRRNPDGFLVGECRDLETMNITIRAANSGHFVYTTIHANSVPEVMSRMLNEFIPEERHARFSDLLSSSKMFLCQYLAKNTKGTRTPVREYLVFTDEIKERLKTVPFENIISALKDIMAEYGEYQGAVAQSMRNCADHLLKTEQITTDVYQHILSGA